MVKKAIVLGLLLAVSTPAAFAGGMGESLIEIRDRTKSTVKSSQSQDQEIDDDSDEGEVSKKVKISSLKRDNAEGFWSSVTSFFKKIVSFFSFK